VKNTEFFTNFKLLLGSILFLFLLFGAIECGARGLGVASNKGEENFRLHWAKLAEETGVYNPEPGIINKMGFHSPEIPVRKAKNTLRVIVLGGSAVYGWKEIETSWVWYLEQRLKSRYPHKKVEVLNAGISGGRSMEELNLLSNLVYLDPDLVITYDGWNDIYSSHYCRDWYQAKAVDVLEDRPSAFFTRLNQWLEHQSYFYLSTKKSFYQFRKEAKAKRRAQKEGVPPALVPPAERQLQALTGDPSAFEKKERTVVDGVTTVQCAEEVDYRLRPSGDLPDVFSKTYFNNLKTMAELSRKQGAGFIAFLQPSLTAAAEQGAVPAESTKILRDANAIFFDDWRNAVKQFYPKAQQVMADLKTNGIPAYDLSAFLSGERALYFTDDVHYRDPVILDQIAAQIETRIDQEGLLANV